MTATAHIIKMTDNATGAATYVTLKGNAKARGRAFQYRTREIAERNVANFVANGTNDDVTFTIEEF